jgi:hypothetical protein
MNNTFEAMFSFIDNTTTIINVDRIEDNCDRESESYGWGLYQTETVDCPDDSQSSNDQDSDSGF